jgi:hypothetical protein
MLLNPYTGAHAHLRQTSECECGKHHHVTNRDVVAASRHEVRGNAEQPCTRDIRAEPRPASQDGDSDRKLDDTYDAHERAGRDGQELSAASVTFLRRPTLILG